jgi:hypothetical protein
MSFSIRTVGDRVDLGANLVEARLSFFGKAGVCEKLAASSVKSTEGANRSKIAGIFDDMLQAFACHLIQTAHIVQPAARPHPGRKRDYAASKAGKLTQGQIRIASPMRRTD